MQNLSKQKNQNNIQNRYICKFNGVRDHGMKLYFINYIYFNSFHSFKIEFIQIEDDNIVNIRKYDEIEKKLIKTNWGFSLHRVYDENIDYEELYENEIVSSDFFADIFKSFKASIIFIGKNSDCFYNSSDYANKFLSKSLKDIFSFNSLPYKYMKNNYTIAISYIDIVDNKIKDNFNFEDEIVNNSEFGLNKLKVVEYVDEIIIDGIKEISIKSEDQAISLLKMVEEKKNLKNKKTKLNSKLSMTHELCTIKIYDAKTKKLVTKLNFLLFKSYSYVKSVGSNYIQDETNTNNFTINTKENFNFFESLHTSNFRLCQVARIIKDTLLSNNNITLISLPISLNYIVLIHDVLNYIKMRKTTILSQQIEEEAKLINHFEEMTIYDGLILSNIEDKENCSYLNNTINNSTNKSAINSYSVTEEDNSVNKKLNITRLMKIENKNNVVLFLRSLNDLNK